MKQTILLTSPIFLSMFLLLPGRLGAQSPNDLVRVEVRVDSESDHKDIKGATADTVTQNKTLQIAISGKPRSSETRTGKWTVYGRDLKGHEVTVLGSGEFKLDLPASGQQKTASTKITTTSTAAHTVATAAASSNKAKGGNVPKAKKVEAAGVKYAGYGVVVKDGDKIVGEAFDPVGLKQEVNK
ncbi:MAG: hypothetical protein QOE70_4454 [Chthoniobacter sp.]|jgi:methionine-rich copper-binding protein CopC|nr:hypothetical protein [Chthoniobacter sp.]